MVAIETEKLTKKYHNHTAVCDFNLTIEKGEVFGFLGPNGAGKSTTIDILLDFIRPTQGRSVVAGFDPQKEPRAVRQQIGILPDDYELYGRLTGREHIEFAIRMNESEENPEPILARVGLANEGEKRVSAYSRGMTQRLALGMALVGSPSILILDEPSYGIDPNGVGEIKKIIREEADRGATVFFSSHILEHVESVCDRVGIIDQGRLITVNTVPELRNTLGTRSTLILTVDTVPANSGLLELDGVLDVESGDSVLRVSCRDSAVKSSVITHVESTNTRIIDIEIEEQSLTDIFTELTTGGDTE